MSRFDSDEYIVNRSALTPADACKQLEPPEYTFHSFRKTVATALDHAGLTPRDIAEHLGHSDPSLTMGMYMSKTVGGRRAADALDGVVESR